MGKKKAIMRKVLSCFFILVILMSVVPVSVFASANSNISSDGVNLTQSTSQSNAKSLKEGIHVLQEESLDLVLTRADYNMSIAVENVSGIGRYTEATAEGKKLLYGYPSAGTSYTTIRIDGNDYYQDTTMDLYVTQMPTIAGDSIVTKWTLPPNVNVSQDLTLMLNTTQYRLTVTNNDHASHRVKIRYMFDTMLADNDGAPFRVPEVGDITTEQEFIPIFDYWKATDSLANPTLTSNCTFDPDNKPYKVQFAHWGYIKSVPFDYTITEGRDITSDTAVGMYWDLGTLIPGETEDVSVYYGIGLFNITEIEIINLFTEFGSYPPNQTVKVYAYIGNAGDAPLIDGQLVINLTNPRDEVVFENFSSLTINPDQTISQSFSYYLPIDALAGIYTINAEIYDAEMKLLDSERTTFRVAEINLSILPENITTSIGGGVSYEITIGNPSDIPTPVTLNLDGLDDAWYILSKESLILNAGEEEKVILNVTVPENPENVGRYLFNVFANRKPVSAVLNVELEPVVSELSPPGDVILSSNDVIFSWKTSVNSTTELYIKPETEADFIKITGESGLDHSVTVENLTRNMNYTWHVKSCSAFGCAISENRTFYIDNGIVFTQDIYGFNIERDYNQHCFVSVKNTDSEAHDLLVRAFNPYDDLYFGFIGHGSADRIISLAPNETEDIELVIHAQDAMLENYTFTVNLTNLGAENITDYALVRVNVRHPYIDFNITEVSTDPITLSKTIRITNYGDPVTDLSITPDEKLKGKVMIQPSLAHCSLGSEESVDMVISPIWAEDIRYIHGTIAATVADESKELFVDYSCGEGKEMYEVILDHPILYFDLKGAWCINCHHVEDIFNFPPGFGRENVVYSYIGMELNAGSGQTRPYNVYIGINGHRVGTLSNTFPSGYYEFDIDSSYLNYATAGIAENKYTLDTDMPGSYYTPLSDVRVVMCVDEINLYICAESQEQAEEIACSASYIHKPSDSITVNILSPGDGSTLNLNQPVLIKAEVLGDGEGEKLSKVITTFNNSDEEIVLVDNGLHDDGQADDGVYANTWTPKTIDSTKIIVTACDCITNNSDIVTVKVGGLPDLVVTKIFFPDANPIEGKSTKISAQIANIGYTDVNEPFLITFSQFSYYNYFEPEEKGRKALINYAKLQRLNAGATIEISVNWDATSICNIKDENITIEVDPCNEIKEVREDNNNLSAPIQVQDLSRFDPEVHGYHFKNYAQSPDEIEHIKGFLKAYFNKILLRPEFVPYEGFINSFLLVLVDQLSEQRGHCYGMSATSILYHTNTISKPVDNQTFYMLKSDEGVISNIDAYQAKQAPALIDILVSVLTKKKSNIKEEYKKVESTIKNDKPMILSVIMYNATSGKRLGGHAVVAYHTYSVSDDIKNVIIYDNNYPGMGRVVRFNSSSNEIEYRYYNHSACKYKYYFGNPIVKHAIAYETDVIKKLIAGIWDFINALVKHLFENKLKLLVFECPVNATITDQYGRIINDKEINEIPGARMGTVGKVKIFFIPINLTYDVEIEGYEDGNLTLIQIFPISNGTASVTGITNVSIEPNTKALIGIRPNATNYTMKIDYNGDGVIDEIKYPDVNETIEVNQLPIASFAYSPAKPIINETITFNATFSHDPDGNIMKYEWDFGDGSNATGKIVTRSYSSIGSYTVTLSVIDNKGAIGIGSKTINVSDITPPTITNAKPGNIIAASGDVINFSCFVTDDSEVEAVWLNYTTNNGTSYNTKIMDNPYNDFYTTNLTLPIVEVIEYKIEASDEVGNMGSSDIYTINVLPTVTIELKKGWNMISLPLKPANLSASSVLQTIQNPAEDRFHIWNASKGEYDAIYGDMELELGRAYRINITADGTWRLSGTETHGVQVNLTHGRNMIGVPSPTNISATDINITVGTDTCNLVEAAKKGYIRGIFYSWNAANGKHDALVILSPDAKLMPGIGYFANVNQDCTITYP